MPIGRFKEPKEVSTVSRIVPRLVRDHHIGLAKKELDLYAMLLLYEPLLANGNRKVIRELEKRAAIVSRDPNTPEGRFVAGTFRDAGLGFAARAPAALSRAWLVRELHKFGKPAFLRKPLDERTRIARGFGEKVISSAEARLSYAQKFLEG